VAAATVIGGQLRCLQKVCAPTSHALSRGSSVLPLRASAHGTGHSYSKKRAGLLGPQPTLVAASRSVMPSTNRHRLFLMATLPRCCAGNQPRRAFAAGQQRKGGSTEGGSGSEAPLSGSSRQRRVELNLSESAGQLAVDYAKKYGYKLAVEWPLKGLKFGGLALLAAGTPPHPKPCLLWALHICNTSGRISLRRAMQA